MNLKKQTLVVAMCFGMLYAQACSFATAIQQLKNWAPTVLTAFSGIVTIINPAAGTGLALANLAITKLFAPSGPVFSAINAYQANPGTGTLANLTAALEAANGQFSAALSDIPANMNANDVKAVQASLLLLITTLESFEARLAPASTTPTAAAHRVSARVAGIAPAKNRSDFVHKYNAIMAQNGHPEIHLR